MTVAAQRALRTAIDRRAFDPVYLFHGDDEFRKDEAVRQLVDAAVDPATRDFNLEVLRGAETAPNRLATALDALPMLADRRVVVVRDAGALKKPARAVLDRWLARPGAGTLLVLVLPAGAKADAALGAAATGVGFPLLAPDAVPTWVTQRVTQQGGTIAPGAAALLAQAVGSDLAQLAGEVDKLLSYSQSDTISEAAVGAVVGVRAGETVADLLDAVAARHGAAAAALVPTVLAQPKTSAVQVAFALTTQALALAWGRAARDRGLPAARLESEFFGLLKSGSAFPGRPWGEAVKCWARHLPRWDAASCDAALAHCLALDAALKDTRLSSDEALLTGAVLAIAAGAPTRAAA
jgi:DNA polymerase-3 subunit delta